MNETLIDTNKLWAIDRLPGWRGRYFDSPSMTFAHYELAVGSSIREHCAGPGCAGSVPANTLHSVKALTNGKAIVVDHPWCDFPGRPRARQ